MIDIRIDLNPAELTANYMKLLAGRMTAVLKAMRKPVIARTNDLIQQFIENSPEYDSILHGQLEGELGLSAKLGNDYAPQNVLESIIVAIQTGVEVEVTPVKVVGNDLDGYIRVSVLKKDLSDIIVIPGASFLSERGYQVDWLHWLLMADTAVVVDTHMFVGKAGLGRTSKGHMEPGPGWHVPSQYAGSLSDNWLTRALDPLGKQLEQVLIEEFKRLA